MKALTHVAAALLMTLGLLNIDKVVDMTKPIECPKKAEGRALAYTTYSASGVRCTYIPQIRGYALIERRGT